MYFSNDWHFKTPWDQAKILRSVSLKKRLFKVEARVVLLRDISLVGALHKVTWGTSFSLDPFNIRESLAKDCYNLESKSYFTMRGLESL